MTNRWTTWLLVLPSLVLLSNDLMAAPTRARHVIVDLVAEKGAAEAGSKLTVAVRERIEPGWHTYWTNPGDSGEPTSVEWNLPEGWSAGQLQWPLPHTIPIGPLMNYGYQGELLLLTDIQLPTKLISDAVTLRAKVSYLVCKDICVPEETTVALTLPVMAKASSSESAGPIEAAREALAIPLAGNASYTVNRTKGALRLSISTDPSLLRDAGDVRFFPLSWGIISNAAPQPKTVAGGELTLDLLQGDTKETPESIEGVLVFSRADGRRAGYAINAHRGPDSADAGGLFEGGNFSGSANASRWQFSGSEGTFASAGIAVLFAFLGGVILNLMPCVFPVLALKALGFAKGAESHRAQGLSYLGGVLASFAALALVIEMLRAGGASVGWGFQFQSPIFVLALAILFFVLGLSLSGAVSFGGSLISLGDDLARKPGHTGYFFTGVLAAIAATPCTAPFMGAALGYALTQPFYMLAAVMLGLGLGFAAPVVALSFIPSLQRLLPAPGQWMETLKEVLAFPLYATAAWLVWVLSIQSGSDGIMAACIALVGTGFAAWLAGKTAFSSLPMKAVAPALGFAAFAIGIMMLNAVEPGLSTNETGTAVLKEEPFTQGRLDDLTSEGRPVFVNLTAAWCITCKVNERIALRSSAVAEAFNSAGVTYLKGDWTRSNPEITELLQRFGRAGVPLYLFYPGQGAQPHVLPQLLTTGLVLDELKASQAASTPTTAKGA